MGDSVDSMEEDKRPTEEDAVSVEENVGTSSKGEKHANGIVMDLDFDDDDDDDDSEDDSEPMDLSSALLDLGRQFLRDFCKKAGTLFFNEYGLISHQINSYNDFIRNGLQKAFDSFGELVVEPGYDPSKRGEGDWRYASVKFGKVTLDKPSFWAGSEGAELKLLPRHARLQNMTYSSRMKVNVAVEV